MLGILFSIIAGALMSVQGVFNTRVSDKIGLWQTNMIVQGSGFLLTLIIALVAGTTSIKNIKEVNKFYLLGGVLGVFIIFTVMKGIKLLGTTCAISTILLAQLTVAALIDAFGFFEMPQIKFGITKFIGIAVMIVGIILFKWKC